MLGVWIFVILLLFLGFCVMPGWLMVFVAVSLVLINCIDWKRIDKQNKRRSRKRKEKKNKMGKEG
jgi:hypothetical protein